MENSNNEQYVYLLVVRTLGRDKTTLAYDVTPFNSLDAVNNTVLYMITCDAKANKGDVACVSYTLHNNIDEDEKGYKSYGRIEFKSGLEKKYAVILRKVQ